MSYSDWLLTLGIILVGGLLGILADRFAYYFHVARKFLWRDHCAECFTPAAWYRFLPVLGLVISRGLCRHCRARLPVQKWLVELAGAASLWGVVFYYFGDLPPATLMDWAYVIIWAALLWGILVLFISDLAYDELPVMVYLYSIFLVGGINIFRGENLFTVLLTAVGAGFFLLILHVVSRYRWVHGHDILLGMLFAMLIGWQWFFVSLVIAYILAIMGGLLAWGWHRPVWKGTSSFGVYLFIALFLQGIFLVL